MMPILNVRDAKVTGPFQLWLLFSDGAQGTVDLAGELWGEVFQPLKDPAYFALGRFDPESRTVVWPNGADFAPEFLRERLQGNTDRVAERPNP
jgi:hypothetical protein